MKSITVGLITLMLFCTVAPNDVVKAGTRERLIDAERRDFDRYQEEHGNVPENARDLLGEQIGAYYDQWFTNNPDPASKERWRQIFESTVDRKDREQEQLDRAQDMQQDLEEDMGKAQLFSSKWSHSSNITGFRTSSCKSPSCFSKHPSGTWVHPLTQPKH